MPSNILVFGASGNVGRPLVRNLIARGEAVRAASRAGATIEGAEGVAFDFARPDNLTSALDGVDRAYLLLPSGHAQVEALLAPVVDALAGRRIKVVLQTALGVDADENIPYRKVERQLERSGTRFAILRPNWFADNFHTFWKQGVAQGVIAVPAADGKTSFIDARDIADSGAALLTTDRHDGRAFNLTGPEAFGYAQAAELISAAIDRNVTYRSVDDGSFIASMTAAGVPGDYAAFIAAIFDPVRQGYTAAVTGDVQALTGHPPRSLQTYIADHIAKLRD